MRTNSRKNLLDKVSALFKAAEFDKFISEKDIVAIKMHWGEEGNIAYIAPPYIRCIVEEIKKCGGAPFITDTNTLYVGSRRNAIDNITTAVKNGFSFSTINAPIIVADGLNGHDYAAIKIDKNHFKEVKIASAVAYSDVLLSAAHFKGHEGLGFGGTFKNIGMGCASPSGKQNMHSDVLPRVTKNVCTGCRMCVKYCPADAIIITEEKKAFINEKKCIGCAECVITCTYEAIKINWRTDETVIQEKMVEYVYGALKSKIGKCGFFNFIMNVSPDCDCCNWNDSPIVPNIGILASRDPVALDMASAEMVNAAPALPNTRLTGKETVKDKFKALNNVNWIHQLEYAEKLGLGNTNYKIVEVN